MFKCKDCNQEMSEEDYFGFKAECEKCRTKRLDRIAREMDRINKAQKNYYKKP